MGEWERQMQADRLAVVQQARKLVAELDSYLAATRLQRRASTIIRKVMPNALIDPRVRYIDMIDDRTDSRANYSGRAACGSALRSAWRRAAG
jgi:hypothetical protein